jgi:hypothetical protein
MAAGAPNHRDFACVSRSREPVMHRSTDRTAPDRRLSGALMTGNQQDNPLSVGDRLIERSVDCAPGAVESHSVKVDDAIGSDRTAAETPVPAPVEGRAGPGVRLRKNLNRFG